MDEFSIAQVTPHICRRLALAKKQGFIFVSLDGDRATTQSAPFRHFFKIGHQNICEFLLGIKNVGYNGVEEGMGDNGKYDVHTKSHDTKQEYLTLCCLAQETLANVFLAVGVNAMVERQPDEPPLKVKAQMVIAILGELYAVKYDLRKYLGRQVSKDSAKAREQPKNDSSVSSLPYFQDPRSKSISPKSSAIDDTKSNNLATGGNTGNPQQIKHFCSRSYKFLSETCLQLTNLISQMGRIGAVAWASRLSLFSVDHLAYSSSYPKTEYPSQLWASTSKQPSDKSGDRKWLRTVEGLYGEHSKDHKTENATSNTNDPIGISFMLGIPLRLGGMKGSGKAHYRLLTHKPFDEVLHYLLNEASMYQILQHIKLLYCQSIFDGLPSSLPPDVKHYPAIRWTLIRTLPSLNRYRQKVISSLIAWLCDRSFWFFLDTPSAAPLHNEDDSNSSTAGDVLFPSSEFCLKNILFLFCQAFVESEVCSFACDHPSQISKIEGCGDLPQFIKYRLGAVLSADNIQQEALSKYKAQQPPQLSLGEKTVGSRFAINEALVKRRRIQATRTTINLHEAMCKRLELRLKQLSPTTLFLK